MRTANIERCLQGVRAPARSLRLGRLLLRGNSSTPHENENPEGISESDGEQPLDPEPGQEGDGAPIRIRT